MKHWYVHKLCITPHCLLFLHWNKLQPFSALLGELDRITEVRQHQYMELLWEYHLKKESVYVLHSFNTTQWHGSQINLNRSPLFILFMVYLMLLAIPQFMCCWRCLLISIGICCTVWIKKANNINMSFVRCWWPVGHMWQLKHFYSASHFIWKFTNMRRATTFCCRREHWYKCMCVIQTCGQRNILLKQKLCVCKPNTLNSHHCTLLYCPNYVKFNNRECLDGNPLNLMLICHKSFLQSHNFEHLALVNTVMTCWK
jgi:hypothetical protein